MSRTLDKLQDAVLASNCRVRAALLLCVTEMLDDLLQNYASSNRKQWYDNFAATRALVWQTLANDNTPSVHSSAALALCHEINKDLHEGRNPDVYRYGPPASAIASALYCATRPDSPSDDVNALFSALSCLQFVLSPDKTVWTSLEINAFKHDPVYLILQQALDYLLDHFGPTPEALQTMREDSRSVAHALKTVLPQTSGAGLIQHPVPVKGTVHD